MRTPGLKVPHQNAPPMDWIELTIAGMEIVKEKSDLYGLGLRN